MAERCSLCEAVWVREQELLEHLRCYHGIIRAEAFLSQVRIYSNNNQKFLSSSLHWRCLKFKCKICQFQTHLRSVMIKHRVKQGHFSANLQELQMKVAIKPCDNASFPKPWPVGSLVNAKLKGHPIWPGIIFREAASGKYFDYSTKAYFIKFFDTYKTTCSWVPFQNVFPYDSDELLKTAKLSNANIKSRMRKGVEWADYVIDWSVDERLEYFQDSASKIRRN